MNWLLLSLGGVLGANARYFLGGAILARSGPGFPYGTLAINVTGCLLIGLFQTLSARLSWPEGWRLFAVTGFLGAYTTFSAFGGETYHLVAVQRHAGAAALYVLLSVGLGIAAVALGHAIARAGLAAAGIGGSVP